MLNLLPFHLIDDDEFEFIFGDFTRFPKDEDMDRLKRLKFNPFSTSTDINSKTEYFYRKILNVRIAIIIYQVIFPTLMTKICL